MSEWQPARIRDFHDAGHPKLDERQYALAHKIVVRVRPLENSISFCGARAFLIHADDLKRIGIEGERTVCEHDVLTD